MMSGISVTNTPATCPVCEFTTNDNIGTCPKCGGKLLQTEERLDVEEGHDQGKFFAVVSALFLLAILILYKPMATASLERFCRILVVSFDNGPDSGHFYRAGVHANPNPKSVDHLFCTYCSNSDLSCPGPAFVHQFVLTDHTSQSLV